MALGVLYNHSFVLFKTNGKNDLAIYLFNFFDSGSLAVCVFFMVSGLLLTQSFYNTTSKIKFILKRMFRIFPGLMVCLLFTIFIIGSINTETSIHNYFTQKSTYRYLYNILLNNEMFFYDIPSCFSLNKMPHIINGSLWTLPFELISYIYLFIGLSIVQFFTQKTPNKQKLIISIIVLYFSFYMLNGHYIFSRLTGLITGFNKDSIAINNPGKPFLFFGCGMIIYHFKEKIRLSVIFLCLLISLLVICNFLEVEFFKAMSEFLVIIYGTLVIAGLPAVNKLNLRFDPSYGIYLYAWPVQQTFAHHFSLTSYNSMLFTIPCVAFLGCLSYFFIEKPALKLAGRLSITL